VFGDRLGNGLTGRNGDAIEHPPDIAPHGRGVRVESRTGNGRDGGLPGKPGQQLGTPNGPGNALRMDGGGHLGDEVGVRRSVLGASMYDNVGA
jgi:hypothetical protein